MRIRHQICLKAEHSPYWTRIYETGDGKEHKQALLPKPPDPQMTFIPEVSL